MSTSKGVEATPKAARIICNGVVVGAVQDVVVPPEATCTIPSGVEIRHDVVVQPGGVLNDEGAVIDHDLSADNGRRVNVLGGSVGHDISIRSLGRMVDSAGNSVCGVRVGHDLVIRDSDVDAGVITVGGSAPCAGNQVGHNLVVVGNEGGASVSFNTAGHDAKCAHNLFETGTGNSARHKNTCPTGKTSQTVSFSSTAPAAATPISATYSVTATATSGLPAEITVNPSSTGCSLSAGVVTFTAVGTCVLDADQAGNDVYDPAPQAQQSIPVQPVVTLTPGTGATVTGAPPLTGVQLIIGPDAFPDGASIGLIPADPPDPSTPPGSTGQPFTIVSTEQPSAPVELDVPFDPAVDGSPDDVQLGWWSSGTNQWQTVPTTYDPTAKVLRAIIGHFSLWNWLLGKLAGQTFDVPECDGPVPSWAHINKLAHGEYGIAGACAGTDPVTGGLQVRVESDHPGWSYALFEQKPDRVSATGGMVPAPQHTPDGWYVLLPPDVTFEADFKQPDLVPNAHLFATAGRDGRTYSADVALAALSLLPEDVGLVVDSVSDALSPEGECYSAFMEALSPDLTVQAGDAIDCIFTTVGNILHIVVEVALQAALEEAFLIGDIYAAARDLTVATLTKARSVLGLPPPTVIDATLDPDLRVTTTLSADTITAGQTASDTAQVSGHTVGGSGVSGSVTYTAYPSVTDCIQHTNGIDAGTATVSDGLADPSQAVTFSATGTYAWQAVYTSSDTLNTAKSGCESELLTVLPTAAAGTWEWGGFFTDSQMNVIRQGGAAVTLPNGTILAIGGDDNLCTPLTSAEVYQPLAQHWIPTGSMATAHANGCGAPVSAILLGNGKVLVAGDTFSATQEKPELYTVSTGAWTQTGSMLHSHLAPQLVKLTNGKILAVGGGSSAELYDPNTGTWAAAGSSPSTTSDSRTAVLLADGRVMVAGGAVSPSTAFYNPNTNAWTTDANLDLRGYQSAAVLGDGTLLFIKRALSASQPNSVRRYNPTTGVLSVAAGLITPRDRGYSVITLANGKAFVIGGHGTNGHWPLDGELFDPTTNAWTSTGPEYDADGNALPYVMSTARENAFVARLADGRVVVAGGATPACGSLNCPFFRTTDTYTPA